MLKRIWIFLGSLKLGCYLLWAGSVFIFVGSIYGQDKYAFFTKLNEMRVQDWFEQYFFPNWSISWWILVLFLIMFFLGLNTFICTFNRLSTLFKTRKKYSTKKFIIRILPSLIHFFFMLVMLGHFLTFVGIKCQRVSIQAGTKFQLAGDSLEVKEIQNYFYDKDSPLQNRIKQTVVKLTSARGEKIYLSYLNPVEYKGFSLFLDMLKPKKKRNHQEDQEKEVCNKAPVYHFKDVASKNEVSPLATERKLQIKIVSDPGLNLLVVSFFIILFLMFGYFFGLQRLGGV